MEIDGVSAALSQEQTANKRRKLNSTSAEVGSKPAMGGAPIVIDTQFFDDPFGVSREEVCLKHRHGENVRFLLMVVSCSSKTSNREALTLLPCNQRYGLH